MEQLAQNQARGGFLSGVADCVPTLLGYAGIGIAMGVTGVASGLTPLEVFLLSFLVYAGAAQFIICAMLLEGASPALIVLTVLIINARHLLLSVTLVPHFQKAPIGHQTGIALLLTDESFGVASVKAARGDTLTVPWMYGLSLTAYLCWMASCVAGALAGASIPNPHALGFDFALPAMFVALLALQIQSMRGRMTRMLMLAGLTAALVYLLTAVMSGGLAVLAATVVAATVGAVSEK